MILATTNLETKAQAKATKKNISKLTTIIIMRKIVTKKILIEKTLNLQKKSIIVITTQTVCRVMAKAKAYFPTNQIHPRPYQKISKK